MTELGDILSFCRAGFNILWLLLGHCLLSITLTEIVVSFCSTMTANFRTKPFIVLEIVNPFLFPTILISTEKKIVSISHLYGILFLMLL